MIGENQYNSRRNSPGDALQSNSPPDNSNPDNPGPSDSPPNNSPGCNLPGDSPHPENPIDNPRTDAMPCVSSDIHNPSDNSMGNSSDNSMDNSIDPIDNSPDIPIDNPPNPSKNHFGPQSKNLASIIRGLKIGVTTRARTINKNFAWKHRFHEHIIRDDRSFKNISNYIKYNPANWQKEKFS